MKLSFVIGAALGYTLGARAGRERYDQIVRAARKVRGSQTVQSTAGVLQAQVDEITGKVRQAVAGHGDAHTTPTTSTSPSGVNGFTV